MSDEKRPRRKYELKQRAAEMAGTRRRITEAAVELHGTVGPARTTTSALARRAGVQRHTVYRHFPTDEALFAACSAHFLHANPRPEPAAWRSVGDPRARLALALDELYAYYERVEPMLANVYRDVELVPALRPALDRLERYLDDAAGALSAGWGARGRRRELLAASLHHAVDFRAWRSLRAGGRLTRGEIAELAGSLVEAAARPQSSIARRSSTRAKTSEPSTSETTAAAAR